MTESTFKTRWYLDKAPKGAVEDQAYQFEVESEREIKHLYSDRVHLTSHPLLHAYAARISFEGTEQPLLNRMIRELFLMLMVEGMRDFPRRKVTVKTPMSETEGEKGYWVGEIADPGTKVIVADIVRAGTNPSGMIFETLTTVIDPANVRMDVFIMSRKMDGADKVIGTDCSGSKIGGSIKDAILVIPEPMVATGGTICQLLDIYKKKDAGVPQMVILLAMIITPEAIRRITEAYPDVIIHAARLDRGMSTGGARQHMPGLYKELEHGLNGVQYIVPGAGGLGERQTNSWV